MIDGFQLTKDLVRFEKGFDSWEEAIRVSATGLLEQGFIKQSYVDSMVNSVKEYGPYIVIAPDIAMPHARPEAGTNKVGFSIMVCEEPVAFGEDPSQHARLFVTLSCVSADTHLQMIQALVGILGEQEQVDRIFSAKTKEELLEIFK